MSSSTPETSGPNPFIFESDDVDILVTYKNKPLVGKVSSTAMSLASPVWRKFLYPPWNVLPSSSEDSEPTAKRRKTIAPVEELDFSEDDGDTLLILLKICHLKFVGISTHLSILQLAQVALLCDKYDCASLVKPWLDLWLSIDLFLDPVMWGDYSLFIAWVFGKIDVFNAVAPSLLLELTTDTSGQVIIERQDSQENSGPVWPPSFIDSLLVTRNESIEKLLAIPYQNVRRFTSEESHRISQCRGMRKECDALVYGSLLQGLGRAGLWPEKDASDVHCSINQLAEKIRNLVVHVYPTEERRISHSQCVGSNLKNEVIRVLKNIPSPVLECHIRHMEVQRAKLEDSA